MKSPIRLFLFVACAALALPLGGCAGLPSNFADETPPLSKNDQNIVIAAATVRQDMPEIELGLETSIPFALNAATKQPSTLVRDGGVLYLIGAGLQEVTGGTSVSSTLVADAATSLKTTVPASDISVLQSGVTVAQTAFAGIYAHLETLANSATNPDVKAYVLATIPLVANDVGTALVDADEQYAPSTGKPVALTARLERAELHAKFLIVAAPYEDIQHLMLADLRD